MYIVQTLLRARWPERCGGEREPRVGGQRAVDARGVVPRGDVRWLSVAARGSR